MARGAQLNVAAVQEKETTGIDWEATAKVLDLKSPLEIMDHVNPLPLVRPAPACAHDSKYCLVPVTGNVDTPAPHLSSLLLWTQLRTCNAQPCGNARGEGCDGQALATFGDEVAIAWSGAEDVALVEYAHLTGRPYRVFRFAASGIDPFCDA